MKKHPYLSLILAILLSFSAGYYLGGNHSSVHSSSDPVQTQYVAAMAVPKPTSAPKPTAAPKPTSVPKKQKYVLNIRTKKFHYPDCRSVKKMNDSNKKEVTWSRTEIINKGYDPCGNCKP